MCVRPRTRTRTRTRGQGRDAPRGSLVRCAPGRTRVTSESCARTPLPHGGPVPVPVPVPHPGSRFRGCEVSTAEVAESGCGWLMRRAGSVGLASYIFTPVRGSWLIQHHHGSCAASELFLASEMRRAANTVYVYVCTRIPFAGGTGDGPSGSHPDPCAALDLEFGVLSGHIGRGDGTHLVRGWHTGNRCTQPNTVFPT